jgi:DME family drug/metabolite transporter
MTGPGAIVLAAVSWGALGPAIKVLPAGVSPLTVAAVRILVGALGFLPLVIRQRARWRRLHRSDAWRWVAAACAANVVCHLTLVLGLTLAGVAIGDVVHMGLCPVFTALAERALGRGGLTRRWAAVTAVAVTGCVLIVADHDSVAGPHVALGVLVAAVSAVAYSLFTVTSAHLITTGNCSNVVMAVVFSGTALGLAPILAIWPVGWIASARGGAVVLLLGVVATTGAYLMYGYGLRQTPSRMAATLTLAEPATATVIALVFLHERFGVTGGIGLTALIGALVLTACGGIEASRPRARLKTRAGRRRPPRPRGRHARERGSLHAPVACTSPWPASLERRLEPQLDLREHDAAPEHPLHGNPSTTR